MKKTGILFLLLLMAVSARAQKAIQPTYALIPKPDTLIKSEGFFELGAEIKIVAPSMLEPQVSLLKQKLFLASETATTGLAGKIYMHVDDELRDTLGEDGYQLVITPKTIEITAGHKKGVIYGMFTLLQLQQIQDNQLYLPTLKIIDMPRFKYRGMHLDVSRHFFPVSFIKKYLDMMALYKFNTFHWHLTDGQGWRLQIKEYPKLTTEAAWRTNGNKLNWSINNGRFLHEGDPNAYGGYYTQQEAREIVAYAAKRGIRVVPEIEFPAHSEEVMAVYPHLSCSGKPYVNSEFCIGNDSTFIFMKDVLTEVMQIFPSKYIHIGGDEASMESWKTCPLDQALMNERGFTNVKQLQSYAVNKLSRFLSKHERKMIGWDEILMGGLPENATVMAWRGEEAAIKAARHGHDVIMTPGGYYYFDHYQTDPNTQPKSIGGYIPLRKVYRYNPVPKDSLAAAEEDRIIGVQANLWTEYIPTTELVEHRVFPRLLALAATAWNTEQAKNFHDFHRRLQSHYLLLQRHNINYYRPSYRIHIKAKPDYDQERYLISFHTEQYKPTIYYTLGGSAPDTTSLRYTDPFYTSGTTTIKAAIFKNGRQMDSTAVYKASYHKAIGKKVTYHNGGWSQNYPAQYGETLTNGVTGSLTYQDDQWQGFLHDMNVTLDLGKQTELHQLSMRFMQLIGPGVYIPHSVTVFLSDDGEHYTKVGTVQNDVSPTDPRLLFKTFRFDLGGAEAQYIRVKVDDHKGYMFTDEVVVN